MAELKNYIFFDFEMLCTNTGMPFSDMEAIRLGAVKYEIDTGIISKFDQYIRPINKKPLSKFCKDLTGITDNDLKKASSFSMVFTDFLSWVGGVKKARFFSWSKSDLLRLKHDSILHQISPTIIDKIESRYIDFQHIAAKRVFKDHLSVENALRWYGLEFIGKPHNPMYDAWNTLRIYLKFLNNPKQSDLIMLSQFINIDEINDKDQLNSYIRVLLKKDIQINLFNLRDVYNMKQAQKVIKRTSQLVRKYENITFNRSGLFSLELIEDVKRLKEFYQELLASYYEHQQYASKIIILDNHIIGPMRKLAI